MTSYPLLSLPCTHNSSAHNAQVMFTHVQIINNKQWEIRTNNLWSKCGGGRQQGERSENSLKICFARSIIYVNERQFLSDTECESVAFQYQMIAEHSKRSSEHVALSQRSHIQHPNAQGAGNFQRFPTLQNLLIHRRCLFSAELSRGWE